MQIENPPTEARYDKPQGERRGLVLDDAALDWLFKRVERDLAGLTALLDQLDRASLAAKRRVTVAFLRTHLPHLPAA